VLKVRLTAEAQRTQRGRRDLSIPLRELRVLRASAVNAPHFKLKLSMIASSVFMLSFVYTINDFEAGFMALTYAPGDDLVFQIESGFGLIRVLAVEGEGRDAVWHILVYQDFYPDVESAEAALARGRVLETRTPHLALTEHAFEKTPAARLGNRPVSEDELNGFRRWQQTGGEVHDRSVLLMLGMR